MTLAQHLKQNHYQNANGVWLTDYSKIKGLRVSASTTNGTSGIGTYRGRKCYWCYNHTTQQFEIE
jgi:hypothetical protein